jgi:hypothetical protein
VSRFRYTAPERLQFREGGGCLSLFGMPFFAAGLFMLLSVAGAWSQSTEAGRSHGRCLG